MADSKTGDLAGWRIGFIGLGLMGRPMCSHLHAAGAQLHVYNRSRGPLEALLAPGIVPASSPAELAGEVDIIVLMVADTPAVEEVLFARNGVIHRAGEGSVIIDMGTTAVGATREFGARFQEIGVHYIDAPVSGGETGAQKATLSIMIGGEVDDIERVMPLFEVLGDAITHVGPVGAGQVAKAANQTIVGLTIGAVAEALALAEQAGVALGKVREALMGGFAASRILEVHGQRMVDREFTPGGKVTTQAKDMQQALELGQSLGLDMPATELNLQLYRRLIEQGDGDLDHSSLFKLYL